MSAADQTKLAILELCNNEEWNKLGGRLLVPVHDELIAECPIENYERCAELLSDCMCKAADFLPFPSKCDVEISLRWYGLSYPCKYSKPESMDNMTEDNIKWVQYHLLEMEYDLPVLLNDDGSKPIGDAAKGINGKITDEYNFAISEYLKKYHIDISEFIDHIDHKVIYGD